MHEFDQNMPRPGGDGAGFFSSTRLGFAASQLGLVAVYVFAARLGMAFASLPPGNLTVIWLPAGVALSGLLLFGWRALPAVFIGSYAANAPFLASGPQSCLQTIDLLWSLGPAAVDTLQPALAFALYRRMLPEDPFSTGRGVIRFLFYVALLPCLATSWLVVAVIHLGGYTDAVQLSQVVLHGLIVVLGDTLGICLVVPLFFAFRSPEPHAQDLARPAFTLSALLLTLGLCWLAFVHLPQSRYLILPLLLFFAFCSGLRGLSAALLIISISSAAATSRGYGPFVERTSAMSYATLVSFLLCLLPPFHYIQAVMRELRTHRNKLESRVRERTRELESANRRLREIANTDELTGVRSRRRLLEIGEREVERALRYGRPLALLALDIDHFKRINDGYGHAVGDEVLRELTRELQSRLRQGDRLGRMGGEEFEILLPETGLPEAVRTAEKLRAGISASEIETSAGRLRITVSFGVAALGPGEGLDQALRRADKALYKAKQAGRNRVVAME
jgi:diguanylate cyclase (GGDEF)-like protein